MIEVLANAMVTIVLQYINASSQHTVYLKQHNVIRQFYLKFKK